MAELNLILAIANNRSLLRADLTIVRVGSAWNANVTLAAKRFEGFCNC